MQHIKFESIERLEVVLKTIKHKSFMIGLDGENKPIYNTSLPLPTVEITLTEKIHGMNASVCYSNKEGIYFQKRSEIINDKNDNWGFGEFAKERSAIFMELIIKLAKENNINLDTHRISLFGEFAGTGIQKGSALDGMSKKFIIFQKFKVSNVNEELRAEDTKWYKTKIADKWICSELHSIFNIMNHFVKIVSFNFANFDEEYQDLNDILLDIENSSPIGEYLGKLNNIGEGLIGNFEFLGDEYTFKIKGSKFQRTSVKKPKFNIDNELIQKKLECALKVCQPFRLEQVWMEIFEFNGVSFDTEPNIKKLGDFIKKVITDIIKEETIAFEEFNLTPKEVFPFISKICSKWFFEQLKNFETYKFNPQKYIF